MTRRSWLACALAAGAGLTLSACGGGGDATKPDAEAAGASAAVIARADANCRDFLRETKRIAAGALASPPASALELTTERLVKPSIPLLERIADRQQALEPAAHDPQFDLYANLFDPVVVLAHERLVAGQEGNYPRSRELEEMLTDLGLEQRDAARGVGLNHCDVDFQHVLLSSLTE
jgi:hypothetical protein